MKPGRVTGTSPLISGRKRCLPISSAKRRSGLSRIYRRTPSYQRLKAGYQLS
jgi:hypothetical protein